MEKQNKTRKPTVRKSEVFSVSFREVELDEVQEHVDAVKKDTGLTLTRNQLIRKATLAAVRLKKNPDKTFEELFKAID